MFSSQAIAHPPWGAFDETIDKLRRGTFSVYGDIPHAMHGGLHFFHLLLLLANPRCYFF